MTTDEKQTGRDELLDHDADGIREFDNDLPRWWLYGFYFTIALGAVYFLNFHLLPRPLAGKPGMIAEYEAEVRSARESQAARGSAGAGGIQVATLTDPRDLAQGKAIFEGADNVCYSCHRADLGGMIGPNLTDDRWLHGCRLQDVVTSIKTGYPQKGMMPFGTSKPLTDQQLAQVASYVLSRRGSSPKDPKPVDPERDLQCQ